MLSKLSWYKFKVESYNFRILNVIPVVTTQKIAIGHSRRNENEIKIFHYKNKLNIKENSNRVSEEHNAMGHIEIK